jgi:hypothetical protein
MKLFLATAALSAALSAPALAQSDAPIAIASCMASGGNYSLETGPLPGAGEIRIAYANTADQAAVSVTFDVEQNGRHYLITDAGRFAPGVAIEHRFAGPDVTDGPASCSVLNVHFADGLSWGS